MFRYEQKMLSKTKPFKEVNLKMISSNNPCGVSPSSHGTQNENFENHYADFLQYHCYKTIKTENRTDSSKFLSLF